MENNNSEQIALYKQNGDIALRNEIVLNNMGLVRACAMSMRNMYIKFGETDDVVNEGVLALMDATEDTRRCYRLYPQAGLDTAECEKIRENS